jgi:hypothetical protein
VDGNPKTPLPIMEFTTSAVRLQRPMARTSSWLDAFGGSDSGIAWFYHKSTMAGSRALGLAGTGLGLVQACGREPALTLSMGGRRALPW